MCAVWIIQSNGDRLESVILENVCMHYYIWICMKGILTIHQCTLFLFYQRTTEGKTYFRLIIEILKIQDQRNSLLQTSFGQKGQIDLILRLNFSPASQRCFCSCKRFFLYHVSSVFGKRITSCMLNRLGKDPIWTKKQLKRLFCHWAWPETIFYFLTIPGSCH